MAPSCLFSPFQLLSDCDIVIIIITKSSSSSHRHHHHRRQIIIIKSSSNHHQITIIKSPSSSSYYDQIIIIKSSLSSLNHHQIIIKSLDIIIKSSWLGLGGRDPKDHLIPRCPCRLGAARLPPQPQPSATAQTPLQPRI